MKRVSKTPKKRTLALFHPILGLALILSSSLQSLNVLASHRGEPPAAVQQWTAPDLSTPELQLHHLLNAGDEIKTLYTQTAQYDVPLFKLLKAQNSLVERLQNEHPEYQELMAKKGPLLKLTITPPLGGFEVTSKTIAPLAVEEFKAQLIRTLREISPNSNDPKLVMPKVDLLMNELARESIGTCSSIPSSTSHDCLTQLQTEVKKKLIAGASQGEKKDLSSLLKDENWATKLMDQHGNPVQFKIPEDVARELKDISVLRQKQAQLGRLGMLAAFMNRNTGEGVQLLEGDLHTRIKEAKSNHLEALEDKKDHTDPIIASILRQNSEHAAHVSSLSHSAVQKFSSQVENHKQIARETITLNEMPPQMAILRGLAAGDCSSERSFPYPNDPHERVFFIRDQKGNLKGYLSGTIVEVDGKKSFYAITAAGMSLSAPITETALRGLNTPEAKKRLGIDQVVLPTSHLVEGLINHSGPKSVYNKYTEGKEPKHELDIHYQHPEIRTSIQDETKFNDGLYDHMEHQKGVLFTPKGKEGPPTVSVELAEQATAKKELKNNTLGVVEFLLGLERTQRAKDISKTLEVKDLPKELTKESWTEIADLFKNKNKLPVTDFEGALKAKLLKLGITEADLKTRSYLFEVGRFQAPDAFDPPHTQKSIGIILDEAKRSDFDILIKHDEKKFLNLGTEVAKNEKFQPILEKALMAANGTEPESCLNALKFLTSIQHSHPDIQYEVFKTSVRFLHDPIFDDLGVKEEIEEASEFFLSSLTPPIHADALKKILSSLKNNTSKNAVVWGLGVLGKKHPDLVEIGRVLAQAYKDTHEPLYARTLLKLNSTDPQTLKTLTDAFHSIHPRAENATEATINQLRSPEIDEKKLASWVLSHQNPGPYAQIALFKAAATMATNDGNKKDVDHFFNDLARMRPIHPEMIQRITQDLRYPQTYIREGAIIGLGELFKRNLQTPELEKAVIEAVHDNQIGNKARMILIDNNVHSPDIVDLIAKKTGVSSKEPLEILKAGLKHKDPTLVVLAASALAQVKPMTKDTQKTLFYAALNSDIFPYNRSDPEWKARMQGKMNNALLSGGPLPAELIQELIKIIDANENDSLVREAGSVLSAIARTEHTPEILKALVLAACHGDPNSNDRIEDIYRRTNNKELIKLVVDSFHTPRCRMGETNRLHNTFIGLFPTLEDKPTTSLDWYDFYSLCARSVVGQEQIDELWEKVKRIMEKQEN